jgi:DNA-binding NarL/FixJ family response regulator
LESAYVRFDDPDGGPALECWRPNGSSTPIELQSMLTAAATRERGTVTTSVADPSGDGAVRVTRMVPTFPGESGLVLAGSRRSDFPTDLELHLLRIAVGQAAISIHTARRLAGERAARIAAEAALNRRNTFLATLAEELTIPLATLSERAAQAQAFAVDVDQPLTFANVVADRAGGSIDLSNEKSSGSSFVPPSRLTRRETEVLGLLAQGLSNKEIAGVLWLSERTVERHITGLYRKIGVARRHDATTFAVRNGLVPDAHES